MDLSRHFASFFDEVWPIVQTMAQLVHHCEEVVDALLAHLVPGNDDAEVAFASLLDLVGVLAR